MVGWSGAAHLRATSVVMSSTRVGVAFIVAGVILVVVGSFEDVSRNDVLHTIATTLIVFGAVVLSVSTEDNDQAAD